MKKKALAKGKMVGHKMKMHCGPWHSRWVFIPTGGTMVFRLGPFHGHYDSVGEWHDVRLT